jgi:DNA-nicking Smr family endonuclease
MKKTTTNAFTVKDAALLEWALKDVEPLPGRSLQSSAETLRNDKNKVKQHSKKTHPLDSTLKTREKRAVIKPEKSLLHGTSTGLDKRSAQRMRRGKLEIEARLDLHGCNQDEAYRELKDFIFRTHSQQKRLVLVITGKGNKDFGFDTKKRVGVLREMVPKWLNEQTIRDRIISFDYATQKDGGYGALYVLLKKTRF